MTELNMNPTRSFVEIKTTYTNRMPSGGVSYAAFRHFVLLKNTLYMVRVPKRSYVLCFLPYLISFKYDFHVDTERMIFKTREM